MAYQISSLPDGGWNFPPDFFKDKNNLAPIGGISNNDRNSASDIYEAFVVKCQQQIIEDREKTKSQPSPLFSLFSSLFSSGNKREGPAQIPSIDSSMNFPKFYEDNEIIDRKKSLSFRDINPNCLNANLLSTVRFHYRSCGKHQNRQPIMARPLIKPKDKSTFEGNSSLSSNVDSACGIFGIGILVDIILDNTTNSEVSRPSIMNIGYTSDRDQLLKNKIQFDKWAMDHARIVSIGSVCCCVSWGFVGNGLIHIYKRKKSDSSSANEHTQQQKENIYWKLVAVITPPPPSPEFSPCSSFNPNVISDVCSIVTSEKIVSLAISRVGSIIKQEGSKGGVIQVVPIPAFCWQETAKEPNNIIQIPSSNPSNLSSNRIPGICIIAPLHDVSCLDAVHIPNSDSNASSGVEFVIAATGSSLKRFSRENEKERQIISFWKICMKRLSNPNSPLEISSDILISTSSCFSGINTPQISTILNIDDLKTMIHRKWGENGDKSDKGENHTECKNVFDDSSLLSSDTGALVTIDAPVLQIQFSPVISNKDDDIETSNRLYISILDYHGKISIVSCDRLLSLCGSTPSEKQEHDQSKLLETIHTRRPNDNRRQKDSLYSIVHDPIYQTAWYLENINEEQQNEELLYLVSTTRAGQLNITDYFGSYVRGGSKRKTVFRYTPSSVMKSKLIMLQPDSNLTQQKIYYIQSNSGGDSNANSKLPRSSINIIQRVNPWEVIKLLIDVKKEYRKALEMINSFTDFDSSARNCTNTVVKSNLDAVKALKDSCLTKLWEQDTNALISKEDLRYFCQINDDKYVISEVLRLVTDRSDPSKMTDVPNIDTRLKNTKWSYESLKLFIHEGLFRIQKQFGLQNEQNSSQKSEALLQQRSLISEFHFRLCIYNQLCTTIWNIQFHSKVFFRSFVDMKLDELILDCAKRGDTDALLYLYIRCYNKNNNDLRREILENIPLGISPKLYAYLLPISSPQLGSGDQYYLPYSSELYGQEEKLSPMSFAALKEYYLETKRDLFMDDLPQDDYELHTKEGVNLVEITPLDHLSTIEWYNQRIEKIDSYTGNLQDVLLMCELALQRIETTKSVVNGNKPSLNNDTDILEPEDESTSINFVGRKSLKSMYAFSYQLHAIILSLNPIYNVDDEMLPESFSSSMSASKFEKMSPHEILPLIFKPSSSLTASSVFSQFNQYIEPLVKGIDLSSAQTNSSWTRESFQNAVVSFCLSMLRTKIEGEDLSNSTQSYKEWLEICLLFANLSKTSSAPENRVLSDNPVLINFVLDCTYNQCSSKYLSKEILSLFWDLYECLPVKTQCMLPNDLLIKMDQLKSHLIILELLLHYQRYDGCISVSNMNLLKLREFTAPVKETKCQTEMIKDMFRHFCYGFYFQITETRKNSSPVQPPRYYADSISDLQQDQFNRENLLTMDFLSDLWEMKQQLLIICHDGFDCSTVVEENIETFLVPFLLKKDEYKILSSILFYCFYCNLNDTTEVKREMMKEFIPWRCPLQIQGDITKNKLHQFILAFFNILHQSDSEYSSISLENSEETEEIDYTGLATSTLPQLPHKSECLLSRKISVFQETLNLGLFYPDLMGVTKNLKFFLYILIIIKQHLPAASKEKIDISGLYRVFASSQPINFLHSVLTAYPQIVFFNDDRVDFNQDLTTVIRHLQQFPPCFFIYDYDASQNELLVFQRRELPEKQEQFNTSHELARVVLPTKGCMEIAGELYMAKNEDRHRNKLFLFQVMNIVIQVTTKRYVSESSFSNFCIATIFCLSLLALTSNESGGHEAYSVQKNRELLQQQQQKIFLLKNIVNLAKSNDKRQEDKGAKNEEGFSAYIILHAKKALCSFTSAFYSSTFQECEEELSLLQEVLDCLRCLEVQVSKNAFRYHGEQSIPESHHLEAVKGEPSSEFLVFKAAEIFTKGTKKMLVPQTNSNESEPSHKNEKSSSVTYLQYKMIPYHQNVLNFFCDGNSTSRAYHEIIIPILRRIYLDCISNACRIRHHHENESDISYESTEIQFLLQIGTSLLLEENIISSTSAEVTNCNGQVLSFIDEMLSILEQKHIAMRSQEQIQDQDDSFISPNPSFVQKLQMYGYSLNGAKRSVIQTKNTNFESALQYAVAHFQDKNFDMPNVIVQGKHCRRSTEGGNSKLSQHWIQCIKSSLLLTQRIRRHQTTLFSDSTTVDKKRQTLVTSNDNHDQIQIHCTDASSVNNNIEIHNHNIKEEDNVRLIEQHEIQQKQSVLSPAPSIQDNINTIITSKASSDISSSSKATERAAPLPKTLSSSSIKSTLIQSSTLLPPPPTPKIRPSFIAQKSSIKTKHNNNINKTRAQLLAEGKRIREQLSKKNKIVQRVKTPSNSLASAQMERTDRQKYLEDGRRIFLEARMAKSKQNTIKNLPSSVPTVKSELVREKKIENATEVKEKSINSVVSNDDEISEVLEDGWDFDDTSDFSY